MKKLSFIFAMVFAASFAMAQNTANVTEVGNNNTGYVNQLGATNTATIDQIGNLNNASTSDVYASSLFGLLTDTKGVTQVGNHNTGTIIQHNPYVVTPGHPSEAGPIAGLNQTGNWNTAVISQMHNSAWDQEYAWAKQSGDANMSTQNQDYTYGFQSHILQQGRSLASAGDALTTVRNIAQTDQEGGYAQNASIWQDGVRNNAYSFQGDAAFGYTHDNLAETTQKGNDNKSTEYQNGSLNTAKTKQYGSSNTATTKQLTNSNTSNLIQNGDDNEMAITQKIGNLNIVNLTQNGGSEGYVNQFGDNNVLKGLDADIMATSLNGSTLNLDQTGSGNTLSLQQTNGATAIVMQNGITNTSVVIQN